MHTAPQLPAELPTTFDHLNFHIVCDYLGQRDPELQYVIKKYGYPPMWTRNNSFETLVHIILEQQVSLASALAALNKLKEKTKEITPEAILFLDDEEMRACYVSRQKSAYIRGLAQALVNKDIDLSLLENLSAEEVREKLIKLKGIGNWTIDVYLMFTLRKIDIFPIGDLAAVNGLKRLKALAPVTSKEEVMEVANTWKPFRTVACMIIWHFYLSQTSGGIAPIL